MDKFIEKYEEAAEEINKIYKQGFYKFLYKNKKEVYYNLIKTQKKINSYLLNECKDEALYEEFYSTLKQWYLIFKQNIDIYDSINGTGSICISKLLNKDFLNNEEVDKYGYYGSSLSNSDSQRVFKEMLPYDEKVNIVRILEKFSKDKEDLKKKLICYKYNELKNSGCLLNSPEKFFKKDRVIDNKKLIEPSKSDIYDVLTVSIYDINDNRFRFDREFMKEELMSKEDWCNVWKNLTDEEKDDIVNRVDRITPCVGSDEYYNWLFALVKLKHDNKAFEYQKESQ